MKRFSGELIDPVLNLSYLLIRNDIKSPPFGKNRRINEFCFSFSPRS